MIFVHVFDLKKCSIFLQFIVFLLNFVFYYFGAIPNYANNVFNKDELGGNFSLGALSNENNPNSFMWNRSVFSGLAGVVVIDFARANDVQMNDWQGLGRMKGKIGEESRAVGELDGSLLWSFGVKSKSNRLLKFSMKVT